MVQQEINGLYGSNLLQEFGQIIGYYSVYDNGAKFYTDGNEDYVPANLQFKTARSLIDKEARFLFGRKPDFNIQVEAKSKSKDAMTEQEKKDNSTLQNLIDKVMAKNNIGRKLLQAAKDCFIGKRVALIANFNSDGIALNFLPSLEFVFETDILDVDKLNKLVCFFTIEDGFTDKHKTRIYKKKYWMAQDGYCHFAEGVYDGIGNLLEEKYEDETTLFTYIPAVIIINDGLTGDISGVSEIKLLSEYEQWYARLSNADIDAERKGMNPITYAIDISTGSTQGISRAAGAFWDLQSEQNGVDVVAGKVGILENSMTYSSALDTTLKRIKKNMYQQIDMPEIEEIQAQLSSGKALTAVYWGLIARCDEKMLAWKPALEFMCKCIIDGAILYPDSAKKYVMESVPACEYDITAENQYPLQDDEFEEIESDLAKVTAKTMSRKTFMKKWERMTDTDAMSELQQIALENEMLENSFSMSNGLVPPEESDSKIEEPETDDETGTGEDDIIPDESNEKKSPLNSKPVKS